MQVDKMQAGREMDALVAEAIGCTVQCVNGHAWCGCERILPLGWRPHDDPAHASQGLYAYSSDVAAVLPAAEQVVGTGHIKIKLMPPDEWNELYLAQVSLWLGYIDPVRTTAEAATGGQAIALALARAVVTAKETTP